MERPANNLIDWSRPVRSIDNPQCVGIVLAADGINGKRPVFMRHDMSAERERNDQNAAKWTAFRYDEYGRCHSHKLPSPFDLQNFEAA